MCAVCVCGATAMYERQLANIWDVRCAVVSGACAIYTTSQFFLTLCLSSHRRTAGGHARPNGLWRTVWCVPMCRGLYNIIFNGLGYPKRNLSGTTNEEKNHWRADSKGKK